MEKSAPNTVLSTTLDPVLDFTPHQDVGTVLQPLAHRGYTPVERLGARTEKQTYVIRDNRALDDGYYVVQILPFQALPSIHAPEIAPGNITLPPLANIAHSISQFESGGRLYRLRQFIVGQPISWEIPLKSGWSEAQVIELLRAVLSTLAMCHSRGIVHGNLHPDNLIRQQGTGQIILTDFGATLSGFPPCPSVPLRSNVSGRLGRWGYLAPEQHRGQTHPGSDLYALGMIALQLLLGHQSWVSEANLTEALARVTRYGFASIPNRLIAIDPLQRFSRADDVLAALDHYQNPIETPIEAPIKAPIETALEIAPSVTRLLGTSQEIPEASSLEPVAQAESSLQSTAEDLYPISDQAADARSQNALVLVKADWAEADIEDIQIVPVIPAEIVPLAGESKPSKSPSKSNQTPALLALSATVGSAGLLAWAYIQGQLGQMGVHPPLDGVASLDEALADTAALEPLEVPTPPKPSVTGPSFSQSLSSSPLVDGPIQQQAAVFLAKAKRHAKARDFTKALVYLEQIPEQSTLYPIAQQKRVEYRDKREIKAQALLVEAYREGAIANFESALGYLRQIPPNTQAHLKAAAKTLEYREKQQIKAVAQANQIPLSETPG